MVGRQKHPQKNIIILKPNKIFLNFEARFKIQIKKKKN